MAVMRTSLLKRCGMRIKVNIREECALAQFLVHFGGKASTTTAKIRQPTTKDRSHKGLNLRICIPIETIFNVTLHLMLTVMSQPAIEMQIGIYHRMA
ncbi:hypothetical protein Pmar_PMAR014796 [Perkinsus marinus ATCC 50983]|uniref:Uncharacterized protein n=1 Tax=Perkinsus marinus (strain ATCC 50983 / TXsc) TaxID=423536 RepID=C5LSZ2_PERM5|nr:hypothetical protein Pmar_PMAR014796 [Perkinsus marinus ATCC 50983]EER00129.1 hypothetical protein Pmar_PMAR014796 [Perkinsus marinus ATCC 50983]|eukprot:XP_002767411.1 hypothetical protein Pmar_PMAR014796 [Perkinsus marinus ATCC 50983]